MVTAKSAASSVWQWLRDIRYGSPYIVSLSPLLNDAIVTVALVPPEMVQNSVVGGLCGPEVRVTLPSHWEDHSHLHYFLCHAPT